MTTTAAGILRQVRRVRLLTQREFAAAVAEHQSSIADFERGKHDPAVDRLDRLVGAFGYRLTALPTRRHTVADAADAIYLWLRQGRRDNAYRELIQLNDDFGAEDGALAVALAVSPPAPVGDAGFDVFIAALVEHHLEAKGLPVPSWTAATPRLERPWIVDEFADDDVEARTPNAFRRRNIHIDAAELASV